MLTGKIPAQLSTLKSQSLNLRLNFNYLTGIVPAQVYAMFTTGDWLQR